MSKDLWSWSSSFAACNVSLGLVSFLAHSSPWQVSRGSGIFHTLGPLAQPRLHFHSFTQWPPMKKIPWSLIFLNSKASTTITPGWPSSLTWTWPCEPHYHQLFIAVIPGEENALCSLLWIGSLVGRILPKEHSLFKCRLVLSLVTLTSLTLSPSIELDCEIKLFFSPDTLYFFLYHCRAI